VRRAAVHLRLDGAARCARGVGLFVVFAIAVWACTRPVPPGVLSAAFDPDESSPRAIRVTGLSSSELSELSRANWPADRWHELVGVTVAGSSGTFVAGTYVVGKDSVEFVPAFPFDAGRSYDVRIDPARLVVARTGTTVQATLKVASRSAGAPVSVTAIHPDIEEWPANLLRFYVHFSGPMARRAGVEFVHLLDADGREMDDALLESPVDFWSPDQQRVTVFFDPGRVKSDLVPNQMLGRALRVGQQYTIAVDQDWKDASGRPLAAPYRKSIRAVPAVDRPIRLSDWSIVPPRAGTREPLVISVPWALDHALFERSLGVTAGGEPVEGTSTVQPGEREWRFVPDANWSVAPHEIVVLAILEDVSGNTIDQPFEVDPKSAPSAPRPERYSIPLALK